MKSIIFVLAANIFGASFAKALSIQSFQGKPQIEIIDEQAKARSFGKLSLKAELKGQVIVKTGPADEIDLVGSGLELRILPSSEVHFPQIENDSGKAPHIELKSGSLRWVSKTAIDDVTVDSAFFSLKPSQSSCVLSYQPHVPSAEAMVFEGELQFVELNGEQPVTLKEGQKVMFLGRREGGEVSFDKLLKGKIIPKGHKSEIFTISTEENEKYSPVIEAKRKIEKAEKSRLKAKQKIKRKGEICQNPGGLFNECSWKCQNEQGREVSCRAKGSLKCFRYRCNAGGEWKEATPVDNSICAQGPSVGSCDN